MLARRHLRIRVLQILYAFYQNENSNAAAAEKDLFNGTNRLYDLYLTLMKLFSELVHQEKIYMTDVAGKFLINKKKYFRTLASHPFISWLETDKSAAQLFSENKISWQADTETVKKVFFHLRNTSLYKDYTLTEEIIKDDEWLLKLYKEEIQNSEIITSVLEEKNIWWSESIELAHSMVVKTIKNFFSGQSKSLLPLYKDKEDDTLFMQKLLKETIAHNTELTTLIAGRTTNWEVDRIALIDMLILKMALTEVMQFSQIPVKVSINEYIDISKDYSTPQSKSFINGVLDKVIDDLKNDNRLTKTGRGLIEN